MDRTAKWRRALIFGFIGLLLCGVGDWMIGYEPRGGEALLFGITNARVTEVPSWLYVLSMALGVLSGFACREYAPVMLDILDDRGVDKGGWPYRLFRFGLASAPMMFVSFHVLCCACLLYLQAGLRAGLSAEVVDQTFLMPAAFTLVPFLVWCLLVDIPCTVAFMRLVWQGALGLPKAAVVMCPLGVSIVGKLIAAILFALGLDQFAFLTSCGESWGWAFMCLAFLMVLPGDR